MLTFVTKLSGTGETKSHIPHSHKTAFSVDWFCFLHLNGRTFEEKFCFTNHEVFCPYAN